MYPQLPTLLLALTASVLAHPSTPLHRRSSSGVSLTAKNPTDMTCQGPNNGNDVFLGNGGCVIYQPAKGSNIFVDFGDDALWEADIQIFSDTNCKTPLLTLSPTTEMIDNHWSTMCSAMNADWPAWQSAKMGNLVYSDNGSAGLKKE
ncbi:hypothetical protein P7C71_g2546, partial [Lecanoromycetidae sp. Uapishka_2]